MYENCENLIELYKKCLRDISVRNSLELTKTTADCFGYWNQLIRCMDAKEKSDSTDFKHKSNL